MKILYTADLHIRDTIPACRIDNYVEAQFEKLEELIRVAQIEKPDYWLNGGDLFDVHNPSYDLVYRFTKVLKSAKWNGLPGMLSIAGSHDMLAYNKSLLHKTAFGNLIVNDNMEFVDGQTIRGGDKKIPLLLKGISARKDLKYSDYTMDTEVWKNSVPRVIMTHDPITTEAVIFDHMLVSDVAKATNADVVLCSHIHVPFDVTVGKTRFVNPGPMFRQTVNEMKLEPSICILEI